MTAFGFLVLFQCRVIATENRSPSRTSTNTGTVTVSVVRNTAPFFVGNPYTGTINRDANDNDVVVTYTTGDNDNDVSWKLVSVCKFSAITGPVRYWVHGSNMLRLGVFTFNSLLFFFIPFLILNLVSFFCFFVCLFHSSHHTPKFVVNKYTFFPMHLFMHTYISLLVHSTLIFVCLFKLDLVCLC